MREGGRVDHFDPIAFETRIFQRTLRVSTRTGAPEGCVEEYVRRHLAREIEAETGQRLEVPIEWKTGPGYRSAYVEFKYLVRTDG
jgi:hypothetical protein